jgi:hypothetical protein
MKNKSYSVSTIVQTVALCFGVFLVGYYGGVAQSKQLAPKATPPLVADGSKQSLGIHFNFSYPTGWHVFSDGRFFYMDQDPLYDFPHQQTKLIQGVAVDDKKQSLASIEKNKDFKKIDSFKTFLPTTCFQKTKTEEVEGPFPSVNGEVICAVDIPWSEVTTITYLFTGSDTNDSSNFEIFKKFIESIQSNSQ